MIVRATDSKRVHQIDLIPQEQILVLLCGRSRHVHLHHWGALEGAEAFDIKMPETKGCQALTTGVLRPGGPACLLVAVKRQVRNTSETPAAVNVFCFSSCPTFHIAETPFKHLSRTLLLLTFITFRIPDLNPNSSK